MSAAAKRPWASHLPLMWDEWWVVEDVQSEVSEAELQEREVREQARRLKADE